MTPGETKAPRVVRAGAGVLLGASGALMVGASWQRWAGVCRWGELDSAPCLSRQDHLDDFLPVGAPWHPVGIDAQHAGWSLLVLALVVVLLPWALTGRRPGLVPATAVIAGALALVDVGVATLRSGIAGTVVDPVSRDLAPGVWFLVIPVLLFRLAVAARGWRLAASVALILATPLVAAFSYAVGPYDSRPWWEAISGLLSATAGLCLLGDAAFGGRSEEPGEAVVDTTPAPARRDRLGSAR